MKVLLSKKYYGWLMTGLLGDKGRWFLGWSSRPKEAGKEQK